MNSIKTSLNISLVNNSYSSVNRQNSSVETVELNSNYSAPHIVTDVSTSNTYTNTYYNSTTTTTTTTATTIQNYTASTAKRDYVKNIIKGQDVERFVNNYTTFSNLIKPPFVNLGTNTEYTPQGLCKINNETFITEYRDGEKSIIKYIDKNGKEVEVKLDGVPLGCHVGGICYDQSSDNFFICSDNGEVAVYSKNSIVNSTNGSAKALNVFDSGLSSAAYITNHNGRIYVGDWDDHDNSVVKEFTVSKTGNSLVETGYFFEVPPKTQGMTFYTDKNGITTMAISCSYGRNNDSVLKLYNFSSGNKIYNKANTEIFMPPMLEQINFNNNGEITCLFESCSQLYNNGKYRINSTCNIDVKDYLAN